MPRKPDLERRAEIAERAFAFVRAHGIQAANMRAIARALGMKRPTLYWYYRDLGEIFEAVLERALHKQAAFFAERLQAHEHPVDYLAAYVRAAAAFGRRRRETIIALLQLWAVSRAEDPERILARGRAYTEPIRAGLIERLAEGVRRGLVRPCAPHAIVDAVLAFCDGMAVQRVARNPDLEPALEAFIAAVLEPLRTGAGGQQGPQSEPGRGGRRARERARARSSRGGNAA
ncbi:MAG: hypothetical protein KatS3mg102_1857 [Planctomycetota bacterium]|nr:MAG: hypothetical protein KatS3mg102_1857 [Planctomycetota bacterium]